MAEISNRNQNSHVPMVEGPTQQFNCTLLNITTQQHSEVKAIHQNETYALYHVTMLCKMGHF